MLALCESLLDELMEQWKQKAYKRASTSSKQTTQKMKMIRMACTCMCSSPQLSGVVVVRSPSLEVVVLKMGCGAAAGSCSLVEAGGVTSCMMGRSLPFWKIVCSLEQRDFILV